MSGILRETIPGIGEKGDRVKIVSTNKKLGRTTIRLPNGTEKTIDSYRVGTIYEEPKA